MYYFNTPVIIIDATYGLLTFAADTKYSYGVNGIGAILKALVDIITKKSYSSHCHIDGDKKVEV